MLEHGPDRFELSFAQRERIKIELGSLLQLYCENKPMLDCDTKSIDFSHETEHLQVAGLSRKKAITEPLWGQELHQYYLAEQASLLKTIQRLKQQSAQHPLSSLETSLLESAVKSYHTTPMRKDMHEFDTKETRGNAQRRYSRRLNEDYVIGEDWGLECDGLSGDGHNVAMLMGRALAIVVTAVMPTIQQHAARWSESHMKHALRRLLDIAIHQLKEAILNTSLQDLIDEKKLYYNDFATTVNLVVPLPSRDQAALLHVGDDRIYQFDSTNTVTQLTTDHFNGKFLTSTVALPAGAITDCQIELIPFRPGSKLLLCTDGLFSAADVLYQQGTIPDSFANRLKQIFSQENNPTAIVRILSEAAAHDQWLASQFDDIAAIVLQRK